MPFPPIGSGSQPERSCITHLNGCDLYKTLLRPVRPVGFERFPCWMPVNQLDGMSLFELFTAKAPPSPTEINSPQSSHSSFTPSPEQRISPPLFSKPIYLLTREQLSALDPVKMVWTRLCTSGRSCFYGKSCHFAHSVEELAYGIQVQKYVSEMPLSPWRDTVLFRSLVILANDLTRPYPTKRKN